VRQPEGVRLASAARSDLIARGEELWNDRSLGQSGLACSSCHLRTDDGLAQVQASFAKPYPHRVEMAADMAELAQVNAAEMVQLCMTVPMASDPLPWDSIELAALAAQVEHLQQELGPKAAKPANPCAVNPCAMKPNPCGANPCATKPNPCAKR
jgi:cytochrome c